MTNQLQEIPEDVATFIKYAIPTVGDKYDLLSRFESVAKYVLERERDERKKEREEAMGFLCEHDMSFGDAALEKGSPLYLAKIIAAVNDYWHKTMCKLIDASIEEKNKAVEEAIKNERKYSPLNDIKRVSMNIVNQIMDEVGTSIEIRKAKNDILDEFVSMMICKSAEEAKREQIEKDANICNRITDGLVSVGMVNPSSEKCSKEILSQLKND
jgi:hypothetical protein